jgi:hypothetical protein
MLFSAPPRLGEGDPGCCRFVSNPVGEFGNSWMCGQQLKSVVFIFQIFLGQNDMNIAVTGPANPQHPIVNLISGERLFVLLILMASFRNQVMLGDVWSIPATEITRSIFMKHN